MKTFQLINDQIPGEILIREDECGKLRCDFTNSDASANQQSFILRVAEGGIEALRKALTPNSMLTELKVTFEDFWNRYDDRINSSKKRTLAKWQKMPDTERQKAYNFLPRYFAAIPSGTRKKYAETYLNAELWNN